jgi:hypothetical protein
MEGVGSDDEKKEKKEMNGKKVGENGLTRRRFIELAGSAGVAAIGASMFRKGQGEPFWEGQKFSQCRLQF